MMPHIKPKCKEDGEELFFYNWGSMGGSHSSYYKCPKCKRVVEIYDRDLPYYEIKETQQYKRF